MEQESNYSIKIDGHFSLIDSKNEILEDIKDDIKSLLTSYDIDYDINIIKTK